MSNDGGHRNTYSEGQAYGLFFALVANDRSSFDRLLDWTEKQLCAGDMASHLPAWLWGQQADGSWGVLDSNSASDADLWIAYILGQAGRLWGARRYSALSDLLAARVLREETLELPGIGLSLLPGPVGFVLDGGRWRLNPSYMPVQVLRWFAAQGGSTAQSWQALLQSSLKVIAGAAPKGWVADWIVLDGQHGFQLESQDAAALAGSYNAIRVYLWAGTLHPDDPDRAALLRLLQPMVDYVREHGAPPESIDILSGQAERAGPSGFVAALLPLLQGVHDSATLQSQRARLASMPAAPDAYYEQSLTLFSLGWMEGVYRYAVDGRLQPRWGGP